MSYVNWKVFLKDASHFPNIETNIYCAFHSLTAFYYDTIQKYMPEIEKLNNNRFILHLNDLRKYFSAKRPNETLFKRVLHYCFSVFLYIHIRKPHFISLKRNKTIALSNYIL